MSLTALPLVSKLSASVIRILGCNPGVMTLQGTNTYLIGTGTKRVLIDSGDEDTAPEYTKLLRSVLESEKTTIEHLVITHWHHDHIGGAQAVQDLVKLHSKSSPVVWKLPRSLEDGGDTERGYPVANFQPLADEQIIEVAGARLKVMHTPGHTTDHACLMLQDSVLFSGDCILGETTAVFEDLHDYMLSLQKILAVKPTVIYPGHGPVVNEPLPKISWYIEHRNKREAQILEFLERHQGKAVGVMEIVSEIYKETAKELWPAAAVNVTHHLEKLSKEKRVQSNGENWSISS